MKRPSLALDRRSIVEWLVRHGEKLLVGVVALAAAGLAWGGIQAIRQLTVQPSQAADAVASAATQAETHIDSVAEPPADLLPPRKPLPDEIDPWRSPLPPWRSNATLTVAEPPPLAILDKPVFEERAKRTKPDVLTVEDLRAVAGIAVLPVAPAVLPPGGQLPGGLPPGGIPPGLAPPGALPPGFGRPPGPDLSEPPRRPPRRGRRPGAPEEPMPMPEIAAPVEVQPGTPGRIVPYVVVTGLIPVDKQRDEYRKRFEGSGFRDAKRDSPLWSDYVIERATVSPDGRETWDRIDLVGTLKLWTTQWTAVDSATIPPEYLLAEGAEDLRSKPTTPIPFCSALPQRIDGGWGLDGFHPWLVDELAKRAAAAPDANALPGGPAGLPGIGDPPGGPGPGVVGPGAVGPGFDGPGFEVPGAVPGALPEMQQPGLEAPKLPPYRFFRFVDTTVQPGRTYRYRVRLAVWNPNLKLPRQHLADPNLANDQKLASEPSAPSSPVAVPDPMRILAGTMRREEIKRLRLKPGVVDVLLLADSAETGNFALRSVLTDVGGLVDVDAALNKPRDPRARGEDRKTGRILLDLRGVQEDRLDGLADKSPGPVPEPFELLCLRPDGSFELATSADSETDIDRYRSTLPEFDTGRREPKPTDPGEIPGDPGLPFPAPGGFPR